MSNHVAPVGDFLLTVEEAALRLKLGRTTMYRLIATGEVASVSIGRLRRVPVEALITYVRDLTTQVDHSAAS